MAIDMKLTLALSRAWTKLRTAGPIGTARLAWVYLRGNRDIDPFDARHGTDTGGVEPLWKLKIESANVGHGHRYQAADESIILEAFDTLGVDPKGFTFVDLGTGKGRPLLVAARYGFRHVIGVEFAPELCAIARSNLAIMGIANGEVHAMDAAEYVFPQTDLVIFFYNSFGPEVLGGVFDQIAKVKDHQVHFVYVRPTHEAFVNTIGFLHRRPVQPANPLIRLWSNR